MTCATVSAFLVHLSPPGGREKQDGAVVSRKRMNPLVSFRGYKSKDGGIMVIGYSKAHMRRSIVITPHPAVITLCITQDLKLIAVRRVPYRV